MKEVWKDILGFEGSYQVSSRGRIRSLDRFVNSLNPKTKKRQQRPVKGVVLKLRHDKDGYNRVCLSNYSKPSPLRVSRIVAVNFVPNPENKPHVNHINGIKNDDRVENVEWATLSENRRHAYSNGLQGKLKPQDVREIRYMIECGMRLSWISDAYGVDHSTISRIKTGDAWAWLN